MFYSLGMCARAELTDLDRRILEFESAAPRGLGAKEEAIRATLDLSPVRYHQRLNALVDTPAALASFPVLVNRLRRVREGRDKIRRAAHHNDTGDD